MNLYILAYLTFHCTPGDTCNACVACKLDKGDARPYTTDKRLVLLTILVLLIFPYILI